MPGEAQRGGQWDAVRALTEPQRRRAYEYVCSQRQPVTRDDVAAGIGISRALAAFHLDKLVEAGLLHAETKAVPGVRAARVGRPAKLYRPSAVQVDLSLPPRQYDLAGRVFALALTAAAAGEPTMHAVRRVAHQQGEQLAPEVDRNGRDDADDTDSLHRTCRLLDRLGYFPERQNDHAVLANCPFRQIVEVATELTCTMNHALINGLLDGAGLGHDVTATLEPGRDRCCVTLTGVRASST